MRWGYYVPHKWPEESTIWEDIYLYPQDPSWDRPAIWLTVEAVDESTFADYGMTRADYEALLGRGLRDRRLLIEDRQMTLRAADFDFPTLLECARAWLEANDLECEDFVAVSHEEMALHADSHHFSIVGDEHSEAAAPPAPVEWSIDDVFWVPSEDVDLDGKVSHCLFHRKADAVTFVGAEELAELQRRGIGELASLPDD